MLGGADRGARQHLRHKHELIGKGGRKPMLVQLKVATAAARDLAKLGDPATTDGLSESAKAVLKVGLDGMKATVDAWLARLEPVDSEGNARLAENASRARACWPTTPLFVAEQPQAADRTWADVPPREVERCVDVKPVVWHASQVNAKESVSGQESGI